MSEKTRLWGTLPAAHRSRLERSMAEGYAAMAEINLSLASEGDDAHSEWGAYEQILAEADSSGDS